MLSPSETDWASELRASVSQRKKRLHAYDRMKAAYVSSGYSEGGIDFFENHYFSWVARRVPDIVSANPRIRIGTVKVGEPAMHAKGLELAENRTIRDSNRRRLLQRHCVDFGFNWSIGLTRPVAAGPASGENDSPPMRPESVRISQERFTMDPVCSSEEEARWKAHLCVIDHSDLIEKAEKDAKLPEDQREGWNLEAIRKLVPGPGKEELGRPKSEGLPDRKEVTYWEIWVPEMDMAEESGIPQERRHLFNGAILTLAYDQKSPDKGNKDEFSPSWIRAPRPFYGPRWGPYVVFGAYPVSDEPWPLGPLTACDPQIKAHNEESLAAHKAMKSYQSGIIVADAKTATVIRDNVEKKGIVVLPGTLKENIIPYQIGGVDQQQLAQLAVTEKNAQSSLGLSDPGQGNVTGVGTATENAIAAQSASTLTGFNRQVFEDGSLQQIKTECWYLFYDNRMSVQLPPEAAAELAAQMGVPPEMTSEIRADWGGDPTAKDFDSYEFEFVPYTMQRPDSPEMQARAMQALSASAALTQAQMANPMSDFEPIGKAIESSLGIPGFVEALNLEAVRQLGMTMLVAQVTGGQGQAGPVGQKPEPPRMNVDVGAGQAKPAYGGGGGSPRGQVTRPEKPKAMQIGA